MQQRNKKHSQNYIIKLLIKINKLKLPLFFFWRKLIGDRAMSPAQSEDSGLAADRGTTYATISLPRDNASTMGIVLSGIFIHG